MSMKHYRERLARYFHVAAEMGMTYAQADSVRRDAERIDTINTRECNGDLERCEEAGRVDHNGKPMLQDRVYVVLGHDRPGPIHYYLTRDMETPARARIEAIAAEIGATIEFQGDPRGLPVCVKKAGRDLWAPINPNKRF